MQSMNLKTQCLLLAGLPLLLELICIGALLFLQADAQSELKKWIRSRQVVELISRINSQYQDMKLSNMNSPNGMWSNPLKFWASKREYDYIIKEIPAELKLLQTLLANQPEERKTIESLLAMYDAQLPELIRWPLLLGPRNPLELQPGQVQLPANKGEFIAVELRMLKLEHEVISRLANIKKNTLPTIVNHQKEERSADRQIESLIYISMLCNILLALGLAWYFYKNTIDRLNTVIANSNRLKQGEPLIPSKNVVDELGILDNSFHAMAHTLRETARKNVAMIQNSMDVLLSLDELGNCINISPSAEKVFGRKPDQLSGTSIMSIVATKNKAQFIEELAMCKTIPTHSFETGVIGMNDESVDILWTVRWSEASQQYFCVAHDISNRKKVERIRQEIVQMVSHDLRSPLTNLMNNLENLEESTLPSLNAEGKNHFEIANRDIDNMIRLINDLLDLEKVKAGMMKLRQTTVDLDRLFQESIEGIVKFSQREQVKVISKPDGVRIDVDLELIARVLTNLLLNALERSPADKLVELSAHLTDQGNLVISVQDSGSEEAKTYFESDKQFKTVAWQDQLTFRLSLCKALIESHSGRIGVSDANERVGSIFWFELPSTRVV